MVRMKWLGMHPFSYIIPFFCPGMSWIFYFFARCPGNVLELKQKSPGSLKKCPGMSWNVLEFDFENIVVTMQELKEIGHDKL